jgi:hypothetical protein
VSILVVQALPQGIIFGADRNVTQTKVASDSSGKSVTVVLGQSQRPKVLRWPNKRALVGYVGAATTGGMPTDEWLYEFIGDHLEFPSFGDLAHDLADKVQEQRAIDEGQAGPEPLIIHLGGFEARGSEQVPVVWYIRNPHGMEGGDYIDIRKEFLCTEEFWRYFPGVPVDQIRELLRRVASQYQPFWFHQGLDLGTFNTLEAFLTGAFALLCRVHPDHSFPQTLLEWQQHLRMTILTYGAYYQAFRGPGEQYVGGGADTVSLTWPYVGAAA